MDREQDIHFIYENGVLRPEEPVNLAEGTRGIAHIRTSVPASAPGDHESGAWHKAQEAPFNAAWDNDEDSIYDTM